jgi:hypothetical protein
MECPADASNFSRRQDDQGIRTGRQENTGRRTSGTHDYSGSIRAGTGGPEGKALEQSLGIDFEVPCKIIDRRRLASKGAGDDSTSFGLEARGRRESASMTASQNNNPPRKSDDRHHPDESFGLTGRARKEPSPPIYFSFAKRGHSRTARREHAWRAPSPSNRPGAVVLRTPGGAESRRGLAPTSYAQFREHAMDMVFHRRAADVQFAGDFFV